MSKSNKRLLEEIEEIASYSTEPDLTLLSQIQEAGGLRAACRANHCDGKKYERALTRTRRAAALRGHAPDFDMTKIVPEGFKVKGVSSLYDKDGKLSAQWVKSQIDEAKVKELLAAMLEAFKEQIPKAEKTKAPEDRDSDLMNLFVITDYHLGMFAWAEETGDAPWNLAIAERTLIAWIDEAVARAPKAEQAVYLNLGDFLHIDGFKSKTVEHGNLLESDGRFPQMVRASIRVQKIIIKRLLETHKNVHAVFAAANHDPASQVWTRETFHSHYEDEPRVTVDLDPSDYGAYQFGDVALFWHHGHKRSEGEVSKVFVGKYRELFGGTKFAYAHTGHRHSTEVCEDNLMMVERHRTLSPLDAHSAGLGYKSGRDAQVITYHRAKGEQSRLRIAFKEGM
jgi:hypothetical protein